MDEEGSEGSALVRLGRRVRWGILALGLLGLALPFAFAETSWKQALAALVALVMAAWLVLFWWATGDPGRRIPEVAFVLGMLGGLLLGGVGAGFYCQLTDCSAGFDALVLLPAGAIVGAFVGGGIGYAVAHRVGRGSHGLGSRRSGSG